MVVPSSVGDNKLHREHAEITRKTIDCSMKIKFLKEEVAHLERRHREAVGALRISMANCKENDFG